MTIFKNSFLKFFCLLLIASSFSCKKYLDLQPPDGIIRQNFWKTKEQVDAAINGVYASLLGPPSNVSDRRLAEYLFLWGELRGDMLTLSTGTTNEERDIMDVNISSSNTITNWRSLYRTINYCNTAIDFAPEVIVNDKTFTQEALNSYLAEVKAIRALMYFYLVRSFRDVPLVLKATSSDEQLQQIPKNTAAEVLDQILVDLADAEASAPITYNTVAADKGRITRYTVNTIQADVYLWMEKYNEAIAACDKVINSGRFALVPGNANWYSTVYVNGNSTEGILELQFDRQNVNVQFYDMLRTRPRFIPSAIVMEEIYTQDALNPDNKDIRGDGAALRADISQIWKYTGVDFNTPRAREESIAHWFVYRYSDVLLMKAEALAQLNRGAEALALVDRVRDRARALNVERPEPTDTEGVSDFILAERAREFAYEGKRWYDLLRHAKRNNYKRLDILLSVVGRSVSPDRQQSAIAKYRDVNSHYFPIYDYELQTDRALVQNPFYK